MFYEAKSRSLIATNNLQPCPTCDEMRRFEVPFFGGTTVIVHASSLEQAERMVHDRFL